MPQKKPIKQSDDNNDDFTKSLKISKLTNLKPSTPLLLSNADSIKSKAKHIVEGELHSEDDDHMYNDGNESEEEVNEEDPDLEQEQENADEVENEDALEENLEVDDEDKGIDDKDENEESEESDAVESEKETFEEDEDKCFYRFATKNAHNEDGNEDSEEELDETEIFDDENLLDVDETRIAKPEERTTFPILTKYERVRIKYDRAQQIALGAKPMMKGIEHLSPVEIAELEIQAKVVPLIIQRTPPNRKKERWYIHELEIVN
jgi:DNA-directed RNA polymerase subunit K/omega